MYFLEICIHIWTFEMTDLIKWNSIQFPIIIFIQITEKPFHERNMGLNENLLPVWQYCPVNPGAQIQENLRISSLHVAPLKHGLGSTLHSSIPKSLNHKITICSSIYAYEFILYLKPLTSIHISIDITLKLSIFLLSQFIVRVIFF